MRDLFGFVVGMALRPRLTTVRLLQRPKRPQLGVAACLFIGGLYTATVFIGYLHGFGAVWEPWLPIPARDYYFWETFFTIPAFIVIAATAAAGTQLAGLALGGRGTFGDTFCVLALSVVLPTLLLMWVPETIVVVLMPDLRAEQLGGFSFMPVWLDIARQVAVPLWLWVTATVAVALVHGLNTLRSAAAVLAGLIPAMLVSLATIR